ncbi:hypothetical protein BDN67DRAFT_781685 [Paxillus ammoniavirescens]|nr:hypothetical protein BDN67DRAFT_781685 [Paxillus ammoniavirescens]
MSRTVYAWLVLVTYTLASHRSFFSLGASLRRRRKRHLQGSNHPQCDDREPWAVRDSAMIDDPGVAIVN